MLGEAVLPLTSVHMSWVALPPIPSNPPKQCLPQPLRHGTLLIRHSISQATFPDSGISGCEKCPFSVTCCQKCKRGGWKSRSPLRLKNRRPEMLEEGRAMCRTRLLAHMNLGSSHPHTFCSGPFLKSLQVGGFSSHKGKRKHPTF